MNYNTVYVGMDVHKENFSLCAYTIDAEKASYHQKTTSDYKNILKYLEFLRTIYGNDVNFICGYEAGCLGYAVVDRTADALGGVSDYRDGFGSVLFGEKEINHVRRYANSILEKVSIGLIPVVIKRGLLIGNHENHKGRSVTTKTFGAQVEINGATGAMGVVVKSTKNNVYSHRIIFDDSLENTLSRIKKEAEREMKRGVTEKSARLPNPTDSASNENIAQPMNSVKDSEYLEKSTKKYGNVEKAAIEHTLLLSLLR